MKDVKHVMNKNIIIKTFSDNLEVIKKIQNELLKRHLVASCQVSEVESSYWWNNKIENSKEYCLRMTSTNKNYNQIELIINNMHNYELPEISYYEIKGNKDFLNWIDENVRVKE